MRRDLFLRILLNLVFYKTQTDIAQGTRSWQTILSGRTGWMLPMLQQGMSLGLQAPGGLSTGSGVSQCRFYTADQKITKELFQHEYDKSVFQQGKIVDFLKTISRLAGTHNPGIQEAFTLWRLSDTHLPWFSGLRLRDMMLGLSGRDFFYVGY